MKRMLAMVAALALALPVQAAPPRGVLANPPGRWAPRDECARLPGAAAFRARLAGVIAGRDAAGLAALSTPDVLLDFGGTTGRTELRRKLAGNEGPKFWRELDAIVRLGCGKGDGQAIMMPWFANEDLGELEGQNIMLVAGANVPLYEVADAKSNVLYRMSWQLVDMPGDWREGDKFQQVNLVGMRRRGYVETALLRSQMGYRISAARERGVWLINAFVAGD